MAWNAVMNAGAAWVVTPVLNKVTTMITAASEPKPELQLYCLATMVQLGELFDRENEHLRIKFDTHRLVFIPKDQASADKSRGRDDLILLKGQVIKCLTEHPLVINTQPYAELRIIYTRALKGLEGLLKSYVDEKKPHLMQHVSANLNFLIKRIRNAVEGIPSKSARKSLLMEASIREQQLELENLERILKTYQIATGQAQGDVKQSKAPSEPASAAASIGSNKPSDSKTDGKPKKSGGADEKPKSASKAGAIAEGVQNNPSPELALVADLQTELAKKKSTLETLRAKHAALNGPAVLSPDKQALHDKIKRIFDARAINSIASVYMDAKREHDVALEEARVAREAAKAVGVLPAAAPPNGNSSPAAASNGSAQASGAAAIISNELAPANNGTGAIMATGARVAGSPPPVNAARESQEKLEEDEEGLPKVIKLSKTQQDALNKKLDTFIAQFVAANAAAQKNLVG